MALSVVFVAFLIAGSKAQDEHHSSHEHHSNSYDSGEHSCDFYEEQWEVREEGNSGKYEYYSSCDHNEHIIFEMETMTEMTADGMETSNKIHSFSGGRWQYSDMKEGHHHHHEEEEPIAVSQNSYYGTETTNHQSGEYINYNLTTMLIHENVDDFDILEQYNVTLYDGVNKWILKLSDWPWLSEDNYLRLCTKIWIQGDAGETNITTYLENELNNEYKIYHFHNHMNMHMPEWYKCGLREEIKSVDIDIHAYSKNDMLICFDFEYCEDSTGDHSHIEYDPFIYFGSMVKAHKQQNIDPFNPFIYTSEIDPCNNGGQFVVNNEDDSWKLDIISMLIGLAIGLVVAICVCIFCGMKNRNKESQDVESKDNKKKDGKKSSKQQQQKAKKRGFFTKVNSTDD